MSRQVEASPMQQRCTPPSVGVLVACAKTKEPGEAVVHLTSLLGEVKQAGDTKSIELVRDALDDALAMLERNANMRRFRKV